MSYCPTTFEGYAEASVHALWIKCKRERGKQTKCEKESGQRRDAEMHDGMIYRKASVQTRERTTVFLRVFLGKTRKRPE